MAGVINNAFKTLNNITGTLISPLRASILKYVRDPLERLMFYNEATAQFCNDHPTLVALSICIIIYIVFLAAVHIMHELAVKILGPTPFHLASAELKKMKKDRDSGEQKKMSPLPPKEQTIKHQQQQHPPNLRSRKHA